VFVDVWLWPTGQHRGAIVTGTPLILRLIIEAVDNPIIMIGVLKIAFSCDTIARQSSVVSQSKVLVHDLLSGAPDFYIWPVALDGVVLGRWMALTVAVATGTRPSRI
jgi:hypothetical protein